MLTGVFCLAINRCKSICAKYLEPLQIVSYDRRRHRVLQFFHFRTSSPPRDLSLAGGVLNRRKSGRGVQSCGRICHKVQVGAVRPQLRANAQDFCKLFVSYPKFLMTGLKLDIFPAFEYFTFLCVTVTIFDSALLERCNLFVNIDT